MVGQFTGNTPLIGHNIQGHSVSAILVRDVPEEVLSTSVTHYGTQGLFGEPTQRTVKHDRDNERRRKWRATQSLKRKAKLNKKAQFEGVSGGSVGSAREASTLPSNGHEPGHTSGHWQGISDLHPPLLHGSPPPSPLVLESVPSPSITSSPSSQENTTPSANTPLTQGQLLRERTPGPYSLPDAPSGAPTLNHVPATSVTPGLGRHNEPSCPAHVTGPGGGYPCPGTDVYAAAAASRSDGLNSSQYDAIVDQGHTARPTYNEYATWMAGNSPRHGCENFIGFPPIAYHTSTAFVTDFDQYHMGMHDMRYSCARAQPPSPYANPGALNSRPEASYGADNSTKHFHTTTPGLETVHWGRSTSSSPPPPTVWSENPEVNALQLSAHTTSGFSPDLSTAQESGRSTDSFNATYQDFLVHHSFDSRDPGSPAPAPGLIEYYPDTPQQVNSKPAPQAYSTTSTFLDNTRTIDVTAERYPHDMSHESGPSYAARPEGGDSIAWSAPPAVTAHADRERSDHIENTMNDAYAYMQAVQVPPPSAATEATYTMPPSLPTPQSSYSELAQALQYHPHDFADDSAPSTMDEMAITPHTMVSAVPGTAFYASLFSGALGIDASGPVPLAPSHPEDITISEDELCVRIIQECFDENERLLSKISSLLLDMDFATEQARDANQQLLATSTWQEVCL